MSDGYIMSRVAFWLVRGSVRVAAATPRAVRTRGDYFFGDSVLLSSPPTPTYARHLQLCQSGFVTSAFKPPEVSAEVVAPNPPSSSKTAAGREKSGGIFQLSGVTQEIKALKCPDVS